MLRALYDHTMALAAHKHAVWVLAGVAFIESSFFPIPPDALLIPMVLAARERAWLYATVCTIASVVGGLFGYAIGLYFFDLIGRPVLELYGYTQNFLDFQAMYNAWGAWIVAGAGLTPFPYKVITIASGVTQLDLFTFMAASGLSRGLRFFIVCALLYFMGPVIRTFIERYLGWVFAAGFVTLIGGFVAIRYVV